MLRVQVARSRKISVLAAKACSNSPMRGQLVAFRPLVRPVSTTSSKPVSDRANDNAFAFVLARLEMVRKQAARNAAAFDRKHTAVKVTSSAPGGGALVSNKSDMSTLCSNETIDQKQTRAHESIDALVAPRSLNSVLTLPVTTNVKPKWKSPLLCGQAFEINDNPKFVGLQRFSKGTKYIGDWLDGKMHGQGKLTCPDGSSYEGMWQHDVRSGHGVATFVGPTKSTTTVNSLHPVDTPSAVARYSGQWKNDTFHGSGCYTYSDGNTLTGDFENGTLRNGHGLVRYAWSHEHNIQKDVYVGDIVDYKRHGQGTYIKTDGTQYTGQLANNRRCGQGVLTFSCGRRIEGNFKDGVLDGSGTITQSDLALYDYVGSFVQGVPQGDGVQTQRSTGNTYSGSFVGGKRHGRGKFVYGDAKSPVLSLAGTWKENKFVGQGQQVNRDGSIIVGYFKNNTVQGELFYPNGEKFVGLLVTVPPYAHTGRGTVRTNNTVYKGELVGGKKQGHGVYTFDVPGDYTVEEPQKQTYTGTFADNNMHGQGVLTCREGTASGEFRDNLLYTGSGKLYVGNVLKWGRWKDGMRQTSVPVEGKNDADGLAPTATDSANPLEAVSDRNSSRTSLASIPLAMQDGNANNMLQGYYTLQISPTTTITGHFVDNYLVGQGVYSHKRNGRVVTYKGPFCKNKPHGEGVTTTKDGIWQGTYDDGIQKYGTFTSHEGTHKYVGETEGFHFNGKGKFEYPGYTYDGDFKMGVRHGYGVFTKHDVFFYAGNWVDNKRQGYGVNVNKQHTYKGMHYNDLQHGEGELIYNHGYTYKGTFFEGYLTNGKITTSWGDSHCGEFTRGVRSGKGVFTFSDGVNISGTWVDGKLQGVATITSPSVHNHDGEASIAVSAPSAATCATGYFENNTLLYQVNNDGSVDIAASSLWNTLPVLNNDNMFAPMRCFLSSSAISKQESGKLHFSDGRVYAGNLRDGKMSGTGVLYSGPVDAKTAPFGAYRLQGLFRENMPYNCKGELMDRGTLFECTWVDGVRQGYAKITQPNLRILEGEYINDKFTIAKKVTIKNIDDAKEPSLLDNTDVPLTRDTVRLEKGLVYSGELSAGAPHGTGKISNSRGEVWEGEFAHGQLVKGFYSIHGSAASAVQGKDKVNTAGGNKLVLVYKGEFHNFQYHGQGKLILKDSVYEGSFENGLPHGYGKCVDSDSIYEGEYARGKRHGVGFITLPSGEVREGVWFNDLFQHTAMRPFGGGW